MLKYYTNWILALFTLWYVLYILKLPLYKYINVYYLSILLLYGYIVILVYDFIEGKKYEITFLLFQILLHMIPLLLLHYYKETNTKYALKTLIIFTTIYIIYILYLNKGIFDVYNKEPRPYNWNEIKLNI